MSYIEINNDKLPDKTILEALCPFNSIEVSGEEVSINSSCRMCKLCVKNGPQGGFVFVENTVKTIDRSHWSGIAVFIEIEEHKIHPVSLEMIGKARELAQKAQQKVIALVIGNNLTNAAKELQYYQVDKVCAYDDKALNDFRIEPYTAVMEDFIHREKPAVFLVGGTTMGRNLAPRTAARFRTGLTADCTVLDIRENGELDQIRPAFGGNIMAHIQTPAHRPQFATVRYKIFPTPLRKNKTSGIIEYFSLPANKLTSSITVLDIHHKEKETHLENAEIIIAAGRGIGTQENLKLIDKLSNLLNAQVAGTRPMIESGLIDPRKQIGLSGRTVRPKLLIACGISGSVQFTAGMNSAERIIAINSDPNAAIFNTAHVGIVGDALEILPMLISNIESGKSLAMEAANV